MQAIGLAVILLLATTAADGAAFESTQRITATVPLLTSGDVFYAGPLPSDGRYVASTSATTAPHQYPITGTGMVAADIDLRTGSFGLYAKSAYPCYAPFGIQCQNDTQLRSQSSFTYMDTLSVRAAGAAPGDVHFVEFAFQMGDPYNAPQRLPSAYNGGGTIDSALRLSNAATGSVASAGMHRLCGGTYGCSVALPTTTTTFDPADGSFAGATWRNFNPPFPDTLTVRVPIYGEDATLDLMLSMALNFNNAGMDYLSAAFLSVVASPGVIVTGTGGLLLQPAAVPEPESWMLGLLGMSAWYAVRRKPRAGSTSRQPTSAATS